MQIGVLVTAYKRDAFINSALLSVGCQVYKPHAVVVVTDTVLDVHIPAMMFERRNIRFTQLVGNYPRIGEMRAAGFAWLRNHGCDVIAFLDDDDEWTMSKLGAVNDVFNMHPDVALVIDNMFVLEADGKHIVLDPRNHWFHGYVAPKPSAFVRAAVGEHMSRLTVRADAFTYFDWRAIVRADDLWTCWEALNHGRIYALSMPFTLWRDHPNSMSNNGSDGGIVTVAADAALMMAFSQTDAAHVFAKSFIDRIGPRVLAAGAPLDAPAWRVLARCAWVAARSLSPFHLRGAARDTARAVLGRLGRNRGT